MELNIPIFRAKKMDSDDYVEGIGIEDNTLIEYIFQRSSYSSENIAKISEIDLSTISIHFPDMLAEDSNSYENFFEKYIRLKYYLQYLYLQHNHHYPSF
jgi:hypothetical protein